MRAGLCDSPAEWTWSSYAATAGALPAPWFLDAPAFLGILGSPDRYVEWVAQGLDSTYLDERGFPVAEHVPSLESLLGEDSDRAIATAHYRHGHSQAAIARHLGVHPSQICRRLASQW